jgi:biopolymer transport protein ExbD
MTDSQKWDVFESESLSVRRDQSQEAVKASLADGTLTVDDLARPAGTATPWKRLGDVVPEWAKASPVTYVSQTPATAEEDLELVDPSIEIDMDSSVQLPLKKPVEAKPELAKELDKHFQQTEEMQFEEGFAASREKPGITPQTPKAMEVPTVIDSDARTEKWLEPSILLEPLEPEGPELGGVVAEDDDEEEFTLSRSSVEKVEELDLAAMVDVAFQLVLFFMVTASVTLIKSMELPKPLESTKPAAASAPGVGTRNKTEVESDFIVVAITADGEIRVEDEPSTQDQLVERLREARTSTGKTGMILRAENKTKHRTAVAAYDAANAIGLKIAIEREVGP